MKIKTGLIVILALGLILQEAFADDRWLPVASKQDKYHLFMDMQTFKREGDVVNVNFRYVYEGKKIFPFINKQYDVLERLYYFQCAQRLGVIANSNYFSGKALVHTISASAGGFMGSAPSYEPRPITAEAEEDEAFSHACQYRPEKK